MKRTEEGLLWAHGDTAPRTGACDRLTSLPKRLERKIEDTIKRVGRD